MYSFPSKGEILKNSLRFHFRLSGLFYITLSPNAEFLKELTALLDWVLSFTLFEGFFPPSPSIHSKKNYSYYEDFLPPPSPPQTNAPIGKSFAFLTATVRAGGIFRFFPCDCFNKAFFVLSPLSLLWCFDASACKYDRSASSYLFLITLLDNCYHTSFYVTQLFVIIILHQKLRVRALGWRYQKNHPCESLYRIIVICWSFLFKIPE